MSSAASMKETIRRRQRIAEVYSNVFLYIRLPAFMYAVPHPDFTFSSAETKNWICRVSRAVQLFDILENQTT